MPNNSVCSIPKIMGIMNVTPDSFYAGSRIETNQSINYTLYQHADIVDIGFESSRPGANPLSEEEELNVASQWRLMWWRFRKHKMAMYSGVILLIFYILFPLAEFVGIGDPAQLNTDYHYLRPQALKWDGLTPYVLGIEGYRDKKTFKKAYRNTEKKLKVGFFCVKKNGIVF